MLTLIVVLPIAVIFFVAFSARTIIIAIQYYKIEGIHISNDYIGNPLRPSLTLNRGESFDFFADGVIDEVKPIRAKKTDIRIVIVGDEWGRAGDILDIKEGTITAKTNLTTQYQNIRLQLLNKDNTTIKDMQGKEFPFITVNIKAGEGDPIDVIDFDISWWLSQVGNEYNQALSAQIIEDKETLVVRKYGLFKTVDREPSQRVWIQDPNETDKTHAYDDMSEEDKNRLNLLAGIVVAPAAYRTSASLESSNESVATIRSDGARRILEIVGVGMATIKVTIQKEGIQPQSTELVVKVVA